MTYLCDLGKGQKIYFDNLGNQTAITLVSQSRGQQQQSSSQFTTGIWSSPPQIYSTGDGMVIKIMTSQGEHHFILQGSQMSIASGSMNLSNRASLPLQQTSSSEIQPLEPMQPLQPMNMGNMQMKMGNMAMNMDASPASQRRFCTQCGSPVKPEDRFCASCGHPLSGQP